MPTKSLLRAGSGGVVRSMTASFRRRGERDVSDAGEEVDEETDMAKVVVGACSWTILSDWTGSESMLNGMSSCSDVRSDASTAGSDVKVRIEVLPAFG